MATDINFCMLSLSTQAEGRRNTEAANRELERDAAQMKYDLREVLHPKLYILNEWLLFVGC